MLEDPLTKVIVEKYTDGINQYIQSLNYKNLPLEYKLMDYSPEEWTPLKVGLLLKSMCQTLNMGEKDAEMTNALKLYGKGLVDLLYPDHELAEDPIVNNPNGWNFASILQDTIPATMSQSSAVVTQHNKSDPTVGSNNWAISGSKTATGSPIFCNDPHLNTTLPSLWYAVQLNAPGINVMGVSLPGAPGVIIGFNDSIAWGITNAQRDLVDWYKITYAGENRDRYVLDGKEISTEKIVEKFDIRGEGTYYDTVVYTTWGPIPYDKNFRPTDGLRDYAFRWISHDPSIELLTFYKLNKAKNYNDYMTALDHFNSPAQNFAFASVSGDIAMRIQGKFPARRKEEGKFLLDGSNSSSGWQAFIPFDQNVMIKNPSRGFVSSANQYPADSTYPYYITAESFDTYRSRRINEILRRLNNITVQDMMMLQNDNYNLMASEALPVLLNTMHTTDTTTFSNHEKKAVQMLRAWNYVNNKDSEASSYFEAWWDHFMYMLWDEMYANSNYKLSVPTDYNTIKLIKERSDIDFFYDSKNTEKKENRDDIVLHSFKVSVAAIEDWKKEHNNDKVKWADYKDTYIRHLARIESFGLHVQHGGNHDIVNASSRTKGPSWRMVVSLEKAGLKAFAVYPGGQSGNPGSASYADMIDRWANGRYFRLSFPGRQEAMEGQLFFSTVLNPKN